MENGPKAKSLIKLIEEKLDTSAKPLAFSDQTE